MFWRVVTYEIDLHSRNKNGIPDDKLSLNMNKSALVGLFVLLGISIPLLLYAEEHFVVYLLSNVILSVSVRNCEIFSLHIYFQYK